MSGSDLHGGRPPRLDQDPEPGRPLQLVKGYRANHLRTPSRPLNAAPTTASQTTGPFFPAQLLRPGENDLTRIGAGRPRAEGQVIAISGRVVDEQGHPVRNALIELWQANTAGRYFHPDDQPEAGDRPLDPNFHGFGRTLTDADGRYGFLTIKPGKYPVPHYKDWWRPPHVHFSIFGAGLMQRLVTQMYFPGDPLNELDPILNGVPDEEARRRLICVTAEDRQGRDGALGCAFDVVLRGKLETPFFED